jgi:hypothetical protein
MLKENPFSLCTPYNRKINLPKATDVQRIYHYTNNAHITSTQKERTLASKSESTVEKTIKESGIKFMPPPLRTGHIRCRYHGSDLLVEHFNGAAPLNKHLI